LVLNPEKIQNTYMKWIERWV